MIERRPAGRPADTREQRRPIAASRRPIAEWAEEELASAKERLQARKAPRLTRPSSDTTPGFWLRVIMLLAVLVLLAVALRASASEAGKTTIAPRDVYVIDGDTVRVRHQPYRLVGFDAPEVGETARCDAEVAKGYDAKARVVDLVWSGKPLTLERIACSCKPGTEGTMLCNYARRCGTLRVAGEDVGAILMREGLAKPYPYRWRRAPPKPKWCG